MEGQNDFDWTLKNNETGSSITDSVDEEHYENINGENSHYRNQREKKLMKSKTRKTTLSEKHKKETNGNGEIINHTVREQDTNKMDKEDLTDDLDLDMDLVDKNISIIEVTDTDVNSNSINSDVIIIDDIDDAETVGPPVKAPEEEKITTDEEREKFEIAIEELLKTVRGVPVLDFLIGRIECISGRDLDYNSLVGFYRITSRMLKEENEKKRESIENLETDIEELKKTLKEQKNTIKASPYSIHNPLVLEKIEKIENSKKGPPVEDVSSQELFVLREKIKQKEQKLNEYMELCDKLKADFTNFRNRSQTEVAFQVEKAFEDLICKFLPILDNFERALKASSTATDIQSIIQGVKMIHYQFEDVLKKLGVMPIKSEGEPFDPKIHEAIETVENEDYPDDTVFEEVYKGYTVKSKVIRPSMVKVSKKKTSG